MVRLPTANQLARKTELDTHAECCALFRTVRRTYFKSKHIYYPKMETGLNYTERNGKSIQQEGFPGSRGSEVVGQLVKDTKCTRKTVGTVYTHCLDLQKREREREKKRFSSRNSWICCEIIERRKKTLIIDSS